MINIKEILYSICEDKNVYNDNYDLLESGLLDSYAFIELLSILEDNGIVIHPTRVDKEAFRTPKSIENLINSFIKS